MSDSPFAQPSAGGDKFEPKDHNGKLLLLYAKSYNPDVETKFGKSEAADVDLIVVDEIDPQTGKPVYLHNARIFGNLARSVRDDVGGTVLGRLGQGANTKGNPPWILLAHTDQDAQVAGPVHQQYQAGLFKTQEQAQAHAADPDPWAGMQTTATPTTAPPPPPAAQNSGATAAGDPNIAKLIANGVDPTKVAQMDPQTRALLAASFPG